MRPHQLYRLLLIIFVTTFSFGALSENVKYSINLLCLNRDMNENSPVICREDLFSQIADSAKKWAKLNPEAMVTLWYDGNLVRLKAIEESKRRLEDKSLKNLVLQDIKTITFVSNNPHAFSSYMPLYFRIDFLKLVIVANDIITKNRTSSIFTDAAVEPMNQAQLLNSEVTKELRAQGLTTNAKDGTKEDVGENQFVQVLNSEPARSALRHTINVNLLRGITSLNLDQPQRSRILLSIFNSPFFSTVKGENYLGGFAARYGAKEIKINTKALGGEDKWVEYNERLHGYLPFGNMVAQGRFLPLIVKGTSIVGPAFEFVRFDGHEVTEAQPGRVLYRRRDIKVRGGKDHIDEVKPKPAGMVFKYNFWM